MRILISGGTGFIGAAVVNALLQRGEQVTVMSRSLDKVKELFGDKVDVLLPADFPGYTGPADAVINLAGEPIIDKRWSPARKQLLRDSRILTTEHLIELIERMEEKPSVLISGSAIGYYGSHEGGVPINEDGPVTSGFTHSLCADWESAAWQAEHHGVRTCMIRTGIVLGNGGALKRMLLPFKLGLGGPIGDGLQWMSWIHLDDQVAAILFLLDQQTLSGPFNLTSPKAVNNEDFSKTLGKVMGRPAMMRMPALVMKLALGEASELVIEGQRVYPENLLEAGFQFRYPDLQWALESILSTQMPVLK